MVALETIFRLAVPVERILGDPAALMANPARLGRLIEGFRQFGRPANMYEQARQRLLGANDPARTRRALPAPPAP